MVKRSVNDLIKFGFFGKISQKIKQGTSIYEVFDQRIVLAELIVKRIRTSKEPISY